MKWDKNYNSFDPESRRQMEVIDIRAAIDELEKRLDLLEKKNLPVLNDIIQKTLNAVNSFGNRVQALENKLKELEGRIDDKDKRPSLWEIFRLR